MADTKISAMTAGAPAQATDAAHFARAGADVSLQVANISAFATGSSVAANGTPANGSLMIYDATNARYSLATLTAGTNVTITNAAGSITIASTGGGSGGSGTVNNGTAGQFALYTATGTAVSGLPLFAYDTTVASPINGFLFQPGATGGGVTIIPVLTGADTSASLTVKAAGATQYAGIFGTSTLSFTYNGSTTQRLLLTTTAATFGTGLAVTVGSSLTVTGQTNHNGLTVHNSGITAPTTTKTAAYTATTADFTIRADATTAAFTVTLPTSPTTGFILNIKKIDSSANAVTVGGTVDGAANPTITTQYTNFQLQYNGSTWDKL